MAAINRTRVLLGAVAGFVVWMIWSFLISSAILGERYTAAQQAGYFLEQPRYGFFIGYWALTLLVLAYILAWLYAAVRTTLGPGPATALKVGGTVGFAAGFPISFAIAAWSPVDRIFPLWWMLELWVGAVVATLVAGWLYRD